MNCFKFPTGEAHFKSEGELSNLLYLPMQANLNDYLMSVALACDVYTRNNKVFDLLMPYLPYSRQDRPTSKEEPFSLKVVGNFLNGLGYRNLITLDVHSDVAYGCVDRLINIGPEQIWTSFAEYNLGTTYPTNREGFIDTTKCTLIVPDQGAGKKLAKLAHRFKNTAIGIKERNTENGHLTLKNIFGDVEGNDCFIVDDICDGGMTFILLTKALLERKARSVNLVVTHGVFTKGVDILFNAGIHQIYTTDSFPQTSSQVWLENVQNIYNRIIK